MISTQEIIKWYVHNSTEYPYITIINGNTFMLRVNDFPDNALYTVVDFYLNEYFDLDDIPTNWDIITNTHIT